MKPTREYGALLGMQSAPLDARTLSGFDAALIVTDHDAVDYETLVTHSRLVVDTRNVTKHVADRSKIVLA
jgi:UDP-N-acetyl-D-glucosamine dehydrogenase